MTRATGIHVHRRLTVPRAGMCLRVAQRSPASQAVFVPASNASSPRRENTCLERPGRDQKRTSTVATA